MVDKKDSRSGERGYQTVGGYKYSLDSILSPYMVDPEEREQHRLVAGLMDNLYHSLNDVKCGQMPAEVVGLGDSELGAKRGLEKLLKLRMAQGEECMTRADHPRHGEIVELIVDLVPPYCGMSVLTSMVLDGKDRVLTDFVVCDHWTDDCLPQFRSFVGLVIGNQIDYLLRRIREYEPMPNKDRDIVKYLGEIDALDLVYRQVLEKVV